LLGNLRAFDTENLHYAAVLQRQGVVLSGLDPPEVDELSELVRVLSGEVVAFGGIRRGIEKLPGLARIVGPHVWRRW
jgi:hypothetical protein